MPQDDFFNDQLDENDRYAITEMVTLTKLEQIERLAADPVIWGNIPVERRLGWSRAQQDFPPIAPRPKLTDSAGRPVAPRSYSSAEAWGEVARAFEAVGFTPDQYYLLRLSLRVDRSPDDHPFFTVLTTGRGRREFRALVASDWTRWPDLLKSGMTPLMATSMVLVGGAANIPDGLSLNANGEVVFDAAG